MGGRLRFLQISDLRLDEPVQGLGSLASGSPPEFVNRVQDVLSTARHRVARRLVNCAIDEQVDFVLLLGNILGSPWSGSSAPWFLMHRLRELQQAGIPVVWSEGDPSAFSCGVPWPSNVHCLSPGLRQPDVCLRLRRGTVRVLQGAPPASHFSADLTISIGPTGGAGNAKLNSQEAIGGLASSRHSPRFDYIADAGATRAVNGRNACSGAAQGNGFGQPGEHGCLIVNWADPDCDIQFLPLDVVRWSVETVHINPGTTWELLTSELQNRIQEKRSADGVEVSVLDWEIDGHGPLWNRLMQPEDQRALEGLLRTQAKRSAAAVWCHRLSLVPDPSQWEEWSRLEGLSTAWSALQDWESQSSEPGETMRHMPPGEDVSPGAMQVNTPSYKRRIKPYVMLRTVRELTCGQSAPMFAN